MHVYLPIAEISIPVESVVFLGAFVGFVSGIFGVGGGFLTTPLLIFMGIPSSIAVGTQGAQIMAAGLSGVMGYWRRGHVDFFMALVILAGGILGTIIGVFFFQFIKMIGQMDLIISLLYIVLLGSIGLMMLLESVFRTMKKKTMRSEFNRFKSPTFISKLPYKMRFTRSKLYISVLVPIGIGVFSGFLVSIMGIGGGFLMVPAMIYILGMPPLLVAGTSLFQVIFTSGFSTIMHATISGSVDIMLALFLILGGVVGAQLGVQAARKVSGAKARIILSLLVLGVCTRLGIQLFLVPPDVFVMSE